MQEKQTKKDECYIFAMWHTGELPNVLCRVYTRQIGHVSRDSRTRSMFVA
jgi:hypothetical protein